MKSVKMIVRVCELWLLRRRQLRFIDILFLNKSNSIGRFWTYGWQLVTRHDDSLDFLSTSFMVRWSCSLFFIVSWRIECIIGHDFRQLLLLNNLIHLLYVPIRINLISERSCNRLGLVCLLLPYLESIDGSKEHQVASWIILEYQLLLLGIG